jgi:hypothetical protein
VPAHRRNLVFLAGVVALILLAPMIFPKPAHACMCARSGSPKDALRDADTVFLGRVAEMTVAQRHPTQLSSADPVTVEFNVSRVWKGPRRETLTVETERMGISCGYEFAVGHWYIVYAYDGHTGLCTRTGPVWLAVRDFAALGLGERPDSTTGAKTMPTPVVGRAEERQPRGGGCGNSAATGGNPTDFTPLALLVGIVWVGARGWRRQ